MIFDDAFIGVICIYNIYTYIDRYTYTPYIHTGASVSPVSGPPLLRLFGDNPPGKPSPLPVLQGRCWFHFQQIPTNTKTKVENWGKPFGK